MKIIVGLGNPGEKYKNTRHNVGQMVVDKVKSQKLKVKSYKSDKFMNDSGLFVMELSKRYTLSPNDLFVVHDDLDIPLGSYKIQFGKGPKDHNGLNDIYEKLGTKDFWHVRVGIDNRLQRTGDSAQGEQYVLEDFTKEEKTILEKVFIEISLKISSIYT